MSTARTWKCPQCGRTEDITYDWLAEHGGPVCEQCDCDMTLQPEAEAANDRDAVVQRLAEKAEAKGLRAEDLDDIIHDLAASIAADINTAGLEDQIRHLVTELGAQHAERQLDELCHIACHPTRRGRRIDMANNYLQFSETMGPLTRKQEAWLQQQLAPIIMVNGKEFPEDEAPDCDKPDYQGLRFLRDYKDLDDDADTCGFGVKFDGIGKRRHAWIYAEEGGDPCRAAHLAQKFLKLFHPDQCWSLTYATTCSKPRVGEFGGGAVFVTADDIRWDNAYDFVEQNRAKFKARRHQATCVTLDEFAILLEKAKQESPLGGGTCLHICLLETVPIPVSGAVLERSDDGAVFLILTDEQEKHNNGKTTRTDP